MHRLQLAAFSSLIPIPSPSRGVRCGKCDDLRLVPHLMSCITPTIDFTRQIGFGRSLHRLGFSSSSLVFPSVLSLSVLIPPPFFHTRTLLLCLTAILAQPLLPRSGPGLALLMEKSQVAFEYCVTLQNFGATTR